MTLYKRITSRLGTQHIFQRGSIGNENYLLRLADHSDYQYALTVSDHTSFYYSGLDYVPSLYHWMLDTGNTFMVLMFIEDNPVAFGIFYIVEPEQEEVLEFACRVVTGYKSKGVYPYVGSYGLNFLKQQIPTLKRQLNAGMSVKSRKEFQKYHKAIVLIAYNRQLFQSSASDINCSVILTNMKPNVKQISAEEAPHIFNHSRNMEVFKHGVFVADSVWIPYKANIDNIVKCAERHLVLVSYSGSTVNAVTFACRLNVESGVLFDIYYYGETVLETYLDHLMTALKSLKENQSDMHKKITFALHFPDDMSTDDVRRFILENKLGVYKGETKNQASKVDVACIEIENLFVYMKEKPRN